MAENRDINKLAVETNLLTREIDSIESELIRLSEELEGLRKELRDSTLNFNSTIQNLIGALDHLAAKR